MTTSLVQLICSENVGHTIKVENGLFSQGWIHSDLVGGGGYVCSSTHAHSFGVQLIHDQIQNHLELRTAVFYRMEKAFPWKGCGALLR